MGDNDIQLRSLLLEPEGTELHYDGLKSIAAPMGPLESSSKAAASKAPPNREGLAGTKAAAVGGYRVPEKPKPLTPAQMQQLANDLLDKTHAQSAMLQGGSSLDHASGTPENGYNTSPKGGFEEWRRKNAPRDSGVDYDYAGAYNAGEGPGPDGHWTDQFKKPNHPTFSDQSQYYDFEPGKAGSWDGDQFVPPANHGSGSGMSPEQEDENDPRPYEDEETVASVLKRGLTRG